MATIEVRVCDVCRSFGRSTSTYYVLGPEMKATLELCEEHAEPLEFVLSKAPNALPSIQSSKRPRRVNSPGDQATTLEAIEAKKKQEARKRKKTPAKPRKA